ncbi:GGDEF domain-containing protein [Alkalibacillus haloalkaliphilus]|uniref:GGDEF domain-containing protein n=1 Tax=Alkalibacillus haloalkaliphilus TaxID=94136 RepID=A0A511W4W4_9BACI|nr:GGDEF domain-containing protein [Alkalibacillus haloalkaliphilus]GEN46139.1 hypothetical protein AHA02nite_19150 [Alkalibacillus haloalkaliphilus]
MNTSRKFAIITIVTIVTILLIWIAIFEHNQYVRLVGASVIPTIGGSIALVWLLKAYKRLNTNNRHFWLLLSLGMLFYVLTNVVWLSRQLTSSTEQFSDFAGFLWIMAYAFFFLALVYKVHLISVYKAGQQFVFNIIILITVATSLSVYYLINPILSFINSPIEVNNLTIIYPLLDLVIVSMVLILYYLSRQANNTNRYIALGFIILVFADSFYIYYVIHDAYRLGGYIDPFWLLAILLIGYASFYAEEHVEVGDKEQENRLVLKNEVYPSILVVVLALLVFHSYDWKMNALGIGLFFIFVLILVRNMILLRHNQNFMEEYKYLAYHDSLTGMYNRSKFREDLNKAFETDEKVGLIVLDLDGFKDVNDQYGHHIGDDLLQSVAERLIRSVKGKGRIYRIGGDEFVIISKDADRQKCEQIVEQILDTLNAPVEIDGHVLRVTPSLGISLYPDDSKGAIELFQYADAAMYGAKKSGKNGYKFYHNL